MHLPATKCLYPNLFRSRFKELRPLFGKRRFLTQNTTIYAVKAKSNRNIAFRETCISFAQKILQIAKSPQHRLLIFCSGTKFGRMHLLDALGNAMPSSLFENNISVDHSGEFVASWDRFYEAPSRPKTFRINFRLQISDMVPFKSNRYDLNRYEQWY
jgi:hypothetical protein